MSENQPHELPTCTQLVTTGNVQVPPEQPQTWPSIMSSLHHMEHDDPGRGRSNPVDVGPPSTSGRSAVASPSFFACALSWAALSEHVLCNATY